jgi:hypothetical protein
MTPILVTEQIPKTHMGNLDNPANRLSSHLMGSLGNPASHLSGSNPHRIPMGHHRLIPTVLHSQIFHLNRGNLFPSLALSLSLVSSISPCH